MELLVKEKHVSRKFSKMGAGTEKGRFSFWSQNSIKKSSQIFYHE